MASKICGGYLAFWLGFSGYNAYKRYHGEYIFNHPIEKEYEPNDFTPEERAIQGAGFSMVAGGVLPLMAVYKVVEFGDSMIASISSQSP